MATLQRVTKEIVELHDFFVTWFNGSVERDQLEPQFFSRLHENLVFIPPEGHRVTAQMLKAGFKQGFGTNPNFRIQITDVAVQHELGNTVLATYTEWQVGSTQSELASNARISTVLIDLEPQIVWRHIHETWLPESERLAGSFDF